jgi:hypothetical protein
VFALDLACLVLPAETAAYSVLMGASYPSPIFVFFVYSIRL